MVFCCENHLRVEFTKDYVIFEVKVPQAAKLWERELTYGRFDG